jgi:ketosteroid isomerase-like protein
MRLARLTLVVTILLAASVSAACAVLPAQGKKADETKLLSAIHREIEMFEAGDADGLMALFADNAVSLPQGSPPVVGKAAIAEGNRAFLDAFNVNFDFELVDYEIAGDYATRQGKWTQVLTPKDGGDPVTVPGKCMVGWKKIDNDWKIVWEIFNFDQS